MVSPEPRPKAVTTIAKVMVCVCLRYRQKEEARVGGAAGGLLSVNDHSYKEVKSRDEGDNNRRNQKQRERHMI